MEQQKLNQVVQIQQQQQQQPQPRFSSSGYPHYVPTMPNPQAQNNHCKILLIKIIEYFSCYFRS